MNASRLYPLRRCEPAEFLDTSGHTQPMVHESFEDERIEQGHRRADACIFVIGVLAVVGFFAGVFG